MNILTKLLRSQGEGTPPSGKTVRGPKRILAIIALTSAAALLSACKSAADKLYDNITGPDTSGKRTTSIPVSEVGDLIRQHEVINTLKEKIQTHNPEYNVEIVPLYQTPQEGQQFKLNIQMTCKRPNGMCSLVSLPK